MPEVFLHIDFYTLTLCISIDYRSCDVYVRPMRRYYKCRINFDHNGYGFKDDATAREARNSAAMKRIRTSRLVARCINLDPDRPIVDLSHDERGRREIVIYKQLRPGSMRLTLRGPHGCSLFIYLNGTAL